MLYLNFGGCFMVLRVNFKSKKIKVRMVGKVVISIRFRFFLGEEVVIDFIILIVNKIYEKFEDVVWFIEVKVVMDKFGIGEFFKNVKLEFLKILKSV